MQLERLKPLARLKPLPSIKTTKNPFLSEIEIISYSANLCLYSMQILRNEITVKNRVLKLAELQKEVQQLNTLLNKRDYYLYSGYTKQHAKEFYKKVGLKP